MARYIDAAKLKIALSHYGKEDAIFIDEIEMYIDDTPTADVAEVKHGHWELAIGYDPNKRCQCQNCFLMAHEPTAYCPHCGAKMDGKERVSEK